MNKKTKYNKSSKLMSEGRRQGIWLYGRHTCLSALGNLDRKILKILVTKSARDLLEKKFPKYISEIELKTSDEISALLPEEAIHQGVAVKVLPLAEKSLGDLKGGNLIILLDQVTDPHNVGAILRSAAAFGAAAVVVPNNSSPSEGGVMAKSASGAMEVVPLIRVVNLSKAIAVLKNNGFWIVGMDGKADMNIKDSPDYDKVGIVMGAEGRGLRRLTAENCDLLVKLPIQRDVESLNVSNAAAIALYEFAK